MNSRNMLAVIMMFICSLMSAQDESVLDRFYRALSGSCAEIVCSYSVRSSGIEISGEGTLVSQGVLWTMKGNGVEMFCDANSLWIADPAMKEVVIEPASYESGYTSNPAILLVRMEDMFVVRQERTMDSGKVLYILNPVEDGDIDYLNVEMSEADATLLNATVAMSDGSLIKIEVSSMKLTPERPVEEFRPQAAFDSSWIITDLR